MDDYSYHSHPQTPKSNPYSHSDYQDRHSKSRGSQYTSSSKARNRYQNSNEDVEEDYQQGQQGPQEGFEEGENYEEKEAVHVPTKEEIEEEENLMIEALLRQYSHKIKRDIIDNINAVRTSKGIPEIYIDHTGGLIAEDYAEFLKKNEHDNEILKNLYDDFNNLGELKMISGKTVFEDPENILETFYEDAVDLGFILLETAKDREILLSPEINHIGLGLSLTKEKVTIVGLLSSKMACIYRMQQADIEEGLEGVELRGRMLVDTHGVYAVRLQKQETKKELGLVGPENVSFDLKSKEFRVYIPTPVDEGIAGSAKCFEIYVRKKPETIEYKQPRKDKLNLNHLELAYRSPCFEYPTSQEEQEDESDRLKIEAKRKEQERKERALYRARLEEADERRERKRQLKQRIEIEGAETSNVEQASPGAQRRRKKWLDLQVQLKKEQEIKEKGLDPNAEYPISQEDIERIEQQAEQNLEQEEKKPEEGEEDDEENEEEEEEEQEEEEYRGSRFEPLKQTAEEQTIKIRTELDLALGEAEKQLDQMQERNVHLQRLINELRDKKDLQLDRMQETTMTEGKYFNMLSHVHQIRQELQSTQDRYNGMARELQGRLEDKQKNCIEIKKAFRSLMSEVAKNAVYSKTDRGIGERRLTL